MKLYLKTRSTDIDYNWVKINSNSASVEPRFISDAELEFQDKISNFEEMSFWAESSLNKKLFLCLCGIPTNRKDKYNRLIRADIVVETEKGKNQNNEKLLFLIKSFIDLIRNNNLIGRDPEKPLPDTVRNNLLSNLLNKSLKKEDVDAYLLLTKEIDKLNKKSPTDKRISEYKEKLSKINFTLSEEVFLTSVEYKDNKPNNYFALDKQSHYYGDITDDKSYYQFLKSIEEMLFGTKYYKIVAICNNKSDKNELADILKQEKEQCVLLGKFDNFDHNGMIPVEIEAKKKSGGYQGNGAPKTQNTYSMPNNYYNGDNSSIPFRQANDSNYTNDTDFSSSQNIKQTLLDAYNNLPSIDKVAKDTKDFFTHPIDKSKKLFDENIRAKKRESFENKKRKNIEQKEPNLSNIEVPRKEDKKEPDEPFSSNTQDPPPHPDDES